ncbi:MAG: hypothetical protein HZB65_01530 [Candidatus Aenigmarchaeota archaeon]|nr:hypothetical protein [Candidatus Aenigmarchaeota archaeon]
MAFFDKRFIEEIYEKNITTEAENGNGYAVLAHELLRLKKLERHICRESVIKPYLEAFSKYFRTINRLREMHRKLTEKIENFNQYPYCDFVPAYDDFSQENIIEAYYSKKKWLLLSYLTKSIKVHKIMPDSHTNQ